MASSSLSKLGSVSVRSLQELRAGSVRAKTGSLKPRPRVVRQKLFLGAVPVAK
jgi:hypothetical protein